MRITSVELENIKSYHKATIAFRGGTTAIRGHNGAGKSTIVEAIGFALFDALSYKQAQFVREGERTGTVTVSFISALDQREYQVVRKCGGSPDWYIHDPETDVHLAEQRTDVIDFLHEHLRIENEVELNALFTDALGVPQGAFTADFLLTPANRKKKFDALLKVEDYRKAAEKLNDTRTYLVEQRQEQQHRVEMLERETNQLPAWREEQRINTLRADELARTLQRIERETATVEQQRERLRTAEIALTKLENEASVAEARHAAAEQRRQSAAEHLAAAQQAAAICDETRPAYEAYRAAEAQLASLRQQETQRNTLNSQRGQVAQQLEGESRDAATLRRHVDEAIYAGERVVALAELVRQQGELERQRDAAQHDQTRLTDVEQRLKRGESEVAAVAKRLADLDRQIAAVEQARPEAERLAARREESERLQAMAAARVAHEQRLQAIHREQGEQRQKLATLAQRVAKARENVRKLLSVREEAERVPALEAAHAEVERDVRQREAAIEQHRRSRDLSGQGNCPFLQEPCLNIQKRGANNLTSYFDKLIARDEAALAPMRSRLNEVTTALEQARERRRYYERLGEYQEQQRQLEADHASLTEQLARLADERSDIEARLADSPDAQAVLDARAAHTRSEEAARKLGQLPLLQTQHDQEQARRQSLTADLAELTRQRDELAGAADRLQQAEKALAALGDPRSQSAAQEHIAQQRPTIEAALHQAEANVAGLKRQLAQLDESLRQYITLDADIQARETQRRQAQPDHSRYEQHVQLAGQLADAAATHQRAAHEAQAAAAQAAQAAQAAAQARAGFDTAQYEQVNRRAEELAGERGSTTQALQHVQEESARLAREITRVEGLLGELSAARNEQQALDDLERMLHYFRETLKEAGPFVLRAMLKRISTEANRIFGDVMGDRSATLSWEQDYEIVLRRDGRERSFAQLSGGEQMSAALAVRLALLRSLTRLDIAFFDEPTQNMDGERRSNLAEQIRRVRGFDQLIVISHDDTFEQGLDDVIHLEKRGNETQLVEAEDALITA